MRSGEEAVHGDRREFDVRRAGGLRHWTVIEENGFQILNVAESRVSGWAEGYGFAMAVVGGVIQTNVDE